MRRAVVLSALLFAPLVQAQVSGSATLVSDDRFRGVSLSDDRPAAQFLVAYDGRTGGYAGLQLSTVRPTGTLRAQALAYLGVVHPLDNGLAWEIGVDGAADAGPERQAYAEAYLGLIGAHGGSGRLYYSRYAGRVPPTLYATLEQGWDLTARLHLSAHVGVMRREGTTGYEPASGRYRTDARLGLGTAWRSLHLQVFWTVTRGGAPVYPFEAAPYRREPDREAVGFSLSYAW